MNEYRVHVELEPVDADGNIDTHAYNEHAITRNQAVYKVFDHLVDNFSHRRILGVTRVEMKTETGEWARLDWIVHRAA